MISYPVFQSQFILSKFRKDLWFLVSGTKFFFHFFYNFRDSFIAFVLIECFKEIQFRVFFNLYAKIVELFDRCIAGKEVCRTRSKADDLKIAQSFNCSCDRKELMNHICTVFGITNRIFRDIGFYITKLQVIACIQHTAVSISTSLAKVILCLLCCCDKHFWSVEMFCKKCFGNFRSKVSKVNTKCIAACFFDVLKSLYHMNFAFYDTDWTFVDILCIIFVCISLYKSFSSVYRK